MDPVKILTVRKIAIDKQNDIATLYINFAKNIQFGQRDLTIPLVSNHCRALDPVFHLDLLLSQTRAPLDSPAFSYRTKSGSLSFVSHKMFTSKLKSLLSRAGFSPERFSGHSLRRGGATFLHQCGASTLQIQACGDWLSSVFTRYLFVSLDQRLQSQRLMSRNLPRFWCSSLLYYSPPLLPSLLQHFFLGYGQDFLSIKPDQARFDRTNTCCSFLSLCPAWPV